MIDAPQTERELAEALAVTEMFLSSAEAELNFLAPEIDESARPKLNELRNRMRKQRRGLVKLLYSHGYFSGLPDPAGDQADGDDPGGG